MGDAHGRCGAGWLPGLDSAFCASGIAGGANSCPMVPGCLGSGTGCLCVPDNFFTRRLRGNDRGAGRVSCIASLATQTAPWCKSHTNGGQKRRHAFDSRTFVGGGIRSHRHLGVSDQWLQRPAGRFVRSDIDVAASRNVAQPQSQTLVDRCGNGRSSISCCAGRFLDDSEGRLYRMGARVGTDRQRTGADQARRRVLHENQIDCICRIFGVSDVHSACRVPLGRNFGITLRPARPGCHSGCLHRSGYDWQAVVA